MEFKIPPPFKELLEQNPSLSGLVNLSISEFGPWLERNNIKFFTEYTDHSLKHIQNVLIEADELIREQCRAIITPSDIATLVLATLLHDCAMHLSTDGFIELVQSESRPVIEGFGDKSWKWLWADFLAEARRFSGRKLMALFGDTKAIDYPPMNSNDMSGRDLLLIGEFLRQHHHRLAHEIALSGVPGPTENKLKLNYTDDTKYIVELAGIVARSHGMSLRDCIPYLRTKFNDEKFYKGVHIIFIMALLRIADILQIQPNRAPKQVEKVQKLLSPVSTGEWKMHQAIDFINKNNADPETIVVVAHPANVKTYLRIRRMLDQIQYELDSSWTVMGETYGYIQKFREIGIRFRRIRSNIDDLDTFSKQVEYIPVQASFEVADTDLLKLLVEPLYGNSPEIGIRELLQNSVDAVIERAEYRKSNKELESADLSDQNGDVVITIDQDTEGWHVAVSDRGIGMTLDTIREYFLKVGASIRRSEVWRKTFEDDEGNSRVLRSGRFGIGALAAFLLGDEIIVSTRHISQSSGIGLEFAVQLDTDVIEFRKIERPVGTTIRIQISESTKEVLLGSSWVRSNSWDWYCLEQPKVIRSANNTILEQQYKTPYFNADLPAGWHRIKHPDYSDIQWTYLDAPSFTCNGIIVKESGYFHEIEGDATSICQHIPNISIFDPNANLPLNLTRTDLTVDKLPFEKELLDDVIRDFIAFSLVNMPSHPLTHPDYYRWYSIYQYVASNDFESQFSSWYSTRLGAGIRLNDGHPGQQLDLSSALVVFNYSKESAEKESINLSKFQTIVLDETQIAIGYSLNNWGNGHELQPDEFKQAIDDVFNRSALFEDFVVLGGRLLISRHILSMFSTIEELGYAGIFNYGRPKLDFVTEWEDENWILLKVNNCSSSIFDFRKFTQDFPDENLEEWPCMVAEVYVQHSKTESELSRFAELWRDIVKLPVIPYNLKDRRENLAHAYKELEIYIRAHEILRDRKLDR